MSSDQTLSFSAPLITTQAEAPTLLKTSLLRPFESHAFRSLLSLAAAAADILNANPDLPKKELANIIERAWHFTSGGMSDASYTARQNTEETDGHLPLAQSEAGRSKSLLSSITGAQAQLSVRVKPEYAPVLGNALILLCAQETPGLREAKICQRGDRARRAETAIVFLTDTLPQTAVQMASHIHKTMTHLVGQIVYPVTNGTGIKTKMIELAELSAEEHALIRQQGPQDLVRGSFYGATPVGTLAILPGISYSETPLASEWIQSSKRKTLALSRAVAEHQTVGKPLDIAVHEQLVKLGYNIENPAFAADMEGAMPLAIRIEQLQAGMPAMAREIIVRTGAFGNNSRRIPLQTPSHPLSTTTLPAREPARMETGLPETDYVFN